MFRNSNSLRAACLRIAAALAGFRERVRRVRLYRDDREALRSDFERVAADLRKVLDRIGNADH